MIDGLLFILTAINFAITITLYIRYSSRKNEYDLFELRDEITKCTTKFNKDAERNIRILEERIKKAQELIKRYEVVYNPKGKLSNKFNSSDINDHKKEDSRNIKKQGSRSLQEDNNLENDKAIFASLFKELSHAKGRAITSSSQSSKSNKYNKQKKTRSSDIRNGQSYIQKAYNKDNNNNTANKYANKLYPGGIDKGDNINIKDEKIENIIESDKKKNKDNSHKVARLIGEGKSYEEIADILGMSLGEIQLLTSLLKKRIIG